MYLTDKIGEDYQIWKPGDVILITAPTGTGKSYFVQRELLKWLITERKGKILYLVNRKILKKQFKEELNDVLYSIRGELFEKGFNVINLEKYIIYETYQHIEMLICENRWREIYELVGMCFIVVCDECHYFYADSSFNPKTELSYNCIRQLFDKKIQIYMSATMDVMKERIKRDCLENNIMPHIEPRNGIYGLTRMKGENNIIEKYDIEKQYDYVKTHLINDISELALKTKDSVKDNNQNNWLIFIDSIDKGRKLKNELIDKGIHKDDIVIIDANYKRDEEAEENVYEIVNNKLMKRKIIISTSVMDNGISIYDEKLKSIVIMADMKETFIQMLGRKREKLKEENIDIYLLKRDKKYFEDRLRNVEEILNKYTEFEPYFDYGRKMLLYFHKYTKNEVESFVIEKYPGFSHMDVGVTYLGYEESYSFKADTMKYQTSQLLDKIMTNQDLYKKIRCFAYAYNNIFYANTFSIEQLMNQVAFYKRVIDDIALDEYAFYKEQCKWLGKTKSIEDIQDDTLVIRELKLKELCEILDRLKGKEMDVDTNRRIKNEEYRELLKELIEERKSYDKEIEGVDMAPLIKSTTNITIVQFNRYMEILVLPFEMVERLENKKKYLQILKK
ncbi:MAG: DEAD/DEAH box helicase family protein [Lachnospiraceae bacterium]|nr:DEAD/DEAH box helicase family protein [Lachnospiraceae bacterium]